MCTGNGQRGMAGIAGRVNSAQQQVRAATSAPTFAGKVQGGVAAANAYTRPVVNALSGAPPSTVVDPDLQQAWKGTFRGNGSRAPSINYGKRNEIQAEQQRRNDLNAQNAAIKTQREAAIAQQQQQQRDMQKQQADLAAAQAKQAAELRAQQAARVAQQAAQQAARTAAIQTTGSAATQSMQILGGQETKQGPTASVDKRRGTRVAGRRTAASSLRIGPTRSAAPGAGANLSV
jgi:hypothetical protein